MSPANIVHLNQGGTSVVLDMSDPQPTMVYWGPELIGVDEADLAALSEAVVPQRVSGGLDSPARLTLLPVPSGGWLGTPALRMFRDSGPYSPAPRLVSARHDEGAVVLRFSDSEMSTELVLRVEVNRAGLLTQQVEVTNLGSSTLRVEDVRLTFPIGPQLTEVLDPTGHHLRERSPQRHDLTFGTYERFSRAGRPSADSPLLVCAGVPGFGFESGRVHGVHLAWSGSFALLVEKSPSGDQFLMAGEYLQPGEVVLEQDECYKSPIAMASWGDGLTQLSHRYIRTVRASLPASRRPVILNTWEAVYFDHDLGALKELADIAADVGVERFVLDDGWFLGRRDDTSSLGDWQVDPDVWPDGLTPLIEHVTGLGMEFGLWVEPEMISPDSEIARAHPDWILRARADLPPTARTQQVIDLSNPEVYQYVQGALSALLDQYDIAYLKWDHNRDLVEAGGGPNLSPRSRDNVHALYALMDQLQTQRPDLEIESCAAGGSRVDAEILRHASRVHTSDSLDPLERLTNQLYTGLIVPPEALGAHLTSIPVHSSNRHISRDLSAKVAMFGHFGVETDLRELSPDELDEVASWISLWKQWKPLIESGFPVHADISDPSLDVRGIVSPDRSVALYTVTQIATSACHPPARIHFPGLDTARTYRVEVLSPSPSYPAPGQTEVSWFPTGLRTTGQLLSDPGFRPPQQFPGDSTLFSVTAE